MHGREVYIPARHGIMIDYAMWRLPDEVNKLISQRGDNLNMVTSA
jgi:hypothetical protein